MISFRFLRNSAVIALLLAMLICSAGLVALAIDAKQSPSLVLATGSEETSSTEDPGSTDDQVENREETEASDTRNEAADPSGQTRVTEMDGLKLEEIVSKSLNAYGGGEVLASCEHNAITFGHLIPAGGTQQNAYTYRKFRRESKWRIDLEAPVAAATGKQGPPKRVFAFNGLAGWTANGQAVSDLNPVKLKQLNDDNQHQPSLLSRWDAEGYEFELEGRTTYRQVPVYSIKLTKSGQSPIYLYIDQRNFLVVGISYETRGMGEPRKVSVEYSEYRPAGGTMYPYKQTKFINGKQASALVLTSLTMSNRIQESLFDRPQSAGKIHLSKPVVVDFEYAQREILVKGRINNGAELLFLFDTGASATIIDRRVAAEHFLAKQGQHQMMAASGSVDVNSSMIKRLELGNLIVNDIPAQIHPLVAQSRQLNRRIGGIIGTNLMKKFVVKIDYAKPALTFYDADSYQRPKKAFAVPLLQPNAPVVKVKLNRAFDLAMLADTGAALNNLPSTVAQKQLAGAAQSSHTTEATGLDGATVKLANIVVSRVAIGGRTVRNVNFTYQVKNDEDLKTTGSKSNLVEKKGGFFRNSRIGILGNPFWQNFVVTLDYKFQRLLLEPNPIVAIRQKINASLKEGDKQLLVFRKYRLAENAYQKALLIATTNKDKLNEAVLWGRMADMRRMMAKDLKRPEHARTAYQYFLKAHKLAAESGDREVEGRILADWSLLYLVNGQMVEAGRQINKALLLAPSDPQVNIDYALHLQRAHRFAEMQKYVEKALFYDPSNWQALLYQFRLYEKFMDYPRALKTLKEIKRYYPWSGFPTAKIKQIQEIMKSNQPSSQPLP